MRRIVGVGGGVILCMCLKGGGIWEGFLEEVIS